MVLLSRLSAFRHSFSFVFAALFVLAGVLIFPSLKHQDLSLTGAVRVVNVYDGDTFKIESGEKVRLLGIDTPELHESKKMLRDASRSGQDIATIKAMGFRASAFVKPLILNKTVRLEFDIEKRDKYGRLLAYVYLDDGTFLNKKIIESGYAVPLTIPPNIKHADEFKMLFKQARARKSGLWD